MDGGFENSISESQLQNLSPLGMASDVRLSICANVMFRSLEDLVEGGFLYIRSSSVYRFMGFGGLEEYCIGSSSKFVA